MTLLTLKLIVLTNFSWTTKRKKIVGLEEEPEIESGNMELDQSGDTIQHS
jgi:hypothetical protein